jgi:hypothetical protein
VGHDDRAFWKRVGEAITGRIQRQIFCHLSRCRDRIVSREHMSGNPPKRPAARVELDKPPTGRDERKRVAPKSREGLGCAFCKSTRIDIPGSGNVAELLDRVHKCAS